MEADFNGNEEEKVLWLRSEEGRASFAPWKIFMVYGEDGTVSIQGCGVCITLLPEGGWFLDDTTGG